MQNNMRALLRAGKGHNLDINAGKARYVALFGKCDAADVMQSWPAYSAGRPCLRS